MKDLNVTKNNYIKNINKEIVNHVDELKRQHTINKVLKNKLKQEIYN